MATFPSLTPNARSLSWGDYPQETYEGASGGNVRFRYGSLRVQQTLSLTYNSITEAQVHLLLDHYDSQQGSLIAFDLPSAVWSGYSSDPIGASYEWRYSGPFSIEPTAPGRFNTSVELVSDLAP